MHCHCHEFNPTNTDKHLLFTHSLAHKHSTNHQHSFTHSLTHSHSQTHSPTNTLDQILLDRLEEGGVLRPVINEDGLEDVPLSASEALRAQRSDADGSVKSTTAVPSMQGMVLVMVLVMVLRL